MISRIDLRGRTLSARELTAILPRPELDVAHVAEQVAPILADVRERGAAALRDLSERFDGVRPEHLRVPETALADALEALDPTVRAGLEIAIRRTRAVHAQQRPSGFRIEFEPGAVVRQRWMPVRRVGLYVPGGLAVYPSSVVMNVVPAQEAGVPSLAVVSPPQADGLPHPAILAACRLLGVEEVYAVGGAQAIAMLAYGAAGELPEDGAVLCEPVDVITGPGNQYVTAAKRLVRGTVGIDSEAGPTEIAILADVTADPRHVAADLVSQAEHGPTSASVLVTSSTELAGRVEELLADLVAATKHGDRVATALGGPQSAIVLVGRPGRRPGRGQRLRCRAPGDPDRGRRAGGRARDRRRGDLRRAVLAGLAGRLHGRLEPRAAHRRLRALRERARRAQLHACGAAGRVRRRSRSTPCARASSRSPGPRTCPRTARPSRRDSLSEE